MLEVSTLRSPKADRRGIVGDHHVGFRAASATDHDDDFIVDDNLLDYIDFSCDVRFFHADGDILPDLEVDPTELLAQFSSPDEPTVSPAEPADACGAHGDAGAKAKTPEVKEGEKELQEEKDEKGLLEEKDVKSNGDEVLSAVTTEDSAAVGSDTKSSASASAEGHSKRKQLSSASASAEGHSKRKQLSSASASAKNSQGKRKVKVDWTPELHRRFVQAVEQLGIDKAVPSRILELMGIECLTRHNIASHLQKYRSHRKHLMMAREAEAASWTQKRQIYVAATAGTGGQVAGGPRKDAAAGPWIVPTIGFPPPGMPHAAAAMVQPAPPPFCRPLHVWGHPTAVEAAATAPPPPMLPVWPRHLAPPQPLPAWAHQPLVDPAYWHQQYTAARKWGPQAVTQGTPCVPPPPAMLQRFAAPPVPGMVPHPMYRPIPPPPPPSQSIKLAGLQLQLDAHPSKESIYEAIGDVLVEPWLPLPLGLKPPSLDSVMSELQKQGIPKVPPATSGSAG